MRPFKAVRALRLASITLATTAVGSLAWSSPAQAAAARAGSVESLRQQVVDLVNVQRRAAGCSPVRLNAQLTAAAQKHADDMARRHYFSHTAPDGTDPGKRISAAGYRWASYGENIAYGQKTPASVMNAWMDSEGHRENILNCSFEEIGVGVSTAPDGPLWTQDFGSR
ncbi:CAP domain-containing protein [Streptomyces sp. NPDC049585]|uniref:CAP domain-containing protein n=1 Tax=Streptomyces sp. NPDC049585 TaxID=3155154 RepID=UPI003438D503